MHRQCFTVLLKVLCIYVFLVRTIFVGQESMISPIQHQAKAITQTASRDCFV